MSADRFRAEWVEKTSAHREEIRSWADVVASATKAGDHNAVAQAQLSQLTAIKSYNDFLSTDTQAFRVSQDAYNRLNAVGGAPLSLTERAQLAAAMNSATEAAAEFQQFKIDEGLRPQLAEPVRLDGKTYYDTGKVEWDTTTLRGQAGAALESVNRALENARNALLPGTDNSLVPASKLNAEACTEVFNAFAGKIAGRVFAMPELGNRFMDDTWEVGHGELPRPGAEGTCRLIYPSDSPDFDRLRQMGIVGDAGTFTASGGGTYAYADVPATVVAGSALSSAWAGTSLESIASGLGFGNASLATAFGVENVGTRTWNVADAADITGAGTMTDAGWVPAGSGWHGDAAHPAEPAPTAADVQAAQQAATISASVQMGQAVLAALNAFHGGTDLARAAAVLALVDNYNRLDAASHGGAAPGSTLGTAVALLNLANAFEHGTDVQRVVAVVGAVNAATNGQVYASIGSATNLDAGQVGAVLNAIPQLARGDVVGAAVAAAEGYATTVIATAVTASLAESGAVVGSAIPVVGTVIGAVIGYAIGELFGSFMAGGPPPPPQGMVSYAWADDGSIALRTERDMDGGGPIAQQVGQSVAALVQNIVTAVNEQTVALHPDTPASDLLAINPFLLSKVGFTGDEAWIVLTDAAGCGAVANDQLWRQAA